jgi:hypothetical protein
MPFTERAHFSAESTTFVATIPPAVRQVIYFVLLLANAALAPLVAKGVVDPVVAVIVVNVSSVFGFSLATSNVTKTVTPDAPVVEVDPDEAAEV